MKPIPWPLDSEVHLYGLTLPQDTAELSRLGGFLTPGETDRAGLLKSERAMKRCIAGRGLLREILGGYLGIEAKHVQLAAGEYGKPLLMDPREKLWFNLSHSGELLLLAVAANREVGIDVEVITSGRPLGEMAKLVLSHHEQDHLSQLSSPHREAAFYRYWVHKEACLKACGRGFSLPGHSFEVSPLNEKSAGMIACCDQKYWHVLDLDMPNCYCAALAVESSCSSQPPPTVVRVDHRLSFNS